MGVDLRCPNCYENLGKDKEMEKDAWCGTCGTTFYNPEGCSYDDDNNEICKQCGKTYDSTNKNPFYCSDCIEENRKKSGKPKEEENKSFFNF